MPGNVPSKSFSRAQAHLQRDEGPWEGSPFEVFLKVNTVDECLGCLGPGLRQPSVCFDQITLLNMAQEK